MARCPDQRPEQGVEAIAIADASTALRNALFAPLSGGKEITFCFLTIESSSFQPAFGVNGHRR